MKTKAILMALVASMMFFAACGDDDEQTLADNTIVYDGQVYTLDDVVVDYYHSELTLLNAYTRDTLESGEPRLAVEGIHLTPNVWNKSFDLANTSQWPEMMMAGMHISGTLHISFEIWNNDGAIGGGGNIDEVQYENTSIFTSGTYTVSGNNDGTPITILYDGVLKNGKTFKMKLVSGNYDTH